MLRLTYMPVVYFFSVFHLLIAWTYAGTMAGIRFVLVEMPSAVWHALPAVLKVEDFRVLRSLKPVYRESYVTHGLSLTAGHPA